MTVHVLHVAVYVAMFISVCYADSTLNDIKPLFSESDVVPSGQIWFGCRTTKGYKLFKWRSPPKFLEVELFEKIALPMIADQDVNSIKECKHAINELKQGIRSNAAWSKDTWFIKTEAPHVRCCF